MERKKSPHKRRIIMDHFDEAMLTFALRDAFPSLRIVTEIHYLHTPHLDERPHLAQPHYGEDRAANLSLLFPEEPWTPHVLQDLPESRLYFLANTPQHSIWYRRGGWNWGTTYGEEPKWAYSLPTPTWGDFIIEYDRQDDSDRAFVRDVWRIMRRITTNRLKSELPHLGVVYCADSRGREWVGHHVLEWCGQVYDRMIDGRLRPIDGWTPPDTPWHRDLRARIVEKFGANFGVPEEPEGRFHEGPRADDIGRLITGSKT